MKHKPTPKSESLNRKPETLFGEFITHSPEETVELAKRIGESLTGGEIFLLRGDLGSGKTVFSKGLAAGLKLDPTDVTSPSFTLVNAYEGRLRFYHIDLYRLDPGALEGLGLEEIFDDEDAVTAVEWAERMGVVPARSIDVQMFWISHTNRKICVVQAEQPG